jgi:hypothetical protein
VLGGLVLYLDAANKKSYPGSGTTWFDLSGNNYTGSLTNGPTFSSTNGGSIVFDGVDDYVQLSNTSFNYNNVTVNIWINRNTTATTYPVIISKESNNTGWILHIINTDKIFWKVNNASNSAITTTGSLATGSWYNITATYDALQLSVYINGKLDTTKPDTSGIFPNSTSIRIGEYQITGNAFKGSMSSIQIYNRALSAQEIQQNYNALKSRFNL